VVEWYLNLLESINCDKVSNVLAKRAPKAIGCPNSRPLPPKVLPIMLGAMDPKASVRDVPVAGIPLSALPLPPNAEVPPPNGLDPVAGLGVAKEKALAVEEVPVAVC
jgi:hypothetical protein